MRFVFVVLSLAVAVQLGFVPPVMSAGQEQVGLSGLDQNGDGVRDDVGQWIEERLSGPGRDAALQFASAFQDILSTAERGATSGGLEEKRLRVKAALQCVLASVDKETQELIFTGLLGEILNTPERVVYVESLERIFPEEDVEPQLSKCILVN